MKTTKVKLTSQIKKKCDEIKTLTRTKIDSILQELDIPSAQKILIKECLNLATCKSKFGRRYTEEWILHSLLLYIRSSSTYSYLYKNKIVPLCSISTVRRYLNSVKIKCGIDSNFFSALKQKFKNKTLFERTGVLMFDEIIVRTSLSVNCRSMKIEGLVDLGDGCPTTNLENGLVDHALVFMFSALGENYMQPVAVYGVKGPVKGTILAKLVLQVIVELTKSGAVIKGIICDGATSNRKMWDELGLSGEYGNVKNSFKNPLNDSKIYAFSDTPHLFKCIRNRMENKLHLKVGVLQL